MLKNLVSKWLLPKVISRSCESRIPRSGEEGEKVNCFVLALDRDNEPFFVATGFEKGLLTGLRWNGERYAEEHTVSIDDLNDGNLRITHYYGLSEVIYSSVYDLAWNYLSKAVYLRIHLYRYISSAHQYFFNKKKLVTKKRMELIQFMMNDQLDREYNGIGVIDLMTKLYSIKWVLHPSADEQQNRLELYLDSLVESGELRKVNTEYVVTGKAISTIEKYEEEERRHTEAVKLQKKMVSLTILIAFVAIVQSGIIKLPVLLDLAPSNESHNNQIQPTQKTRG
ncbi:hypothetical protein [Marinomonas ostreistagni]|uniref:Uncharacterized protein n=1 Tax=Marinomonas ostreistagni TaxID=359209 RepID=A0ABS0ZET9_9GAMM|nr:hypothetical protein [Marinomonas ostreistagni]MBJ7551406.1 hypothetical protein [Marinomonas ostreistagni]